MTWEVTNPWVMYAMYSIYNLAINTRNRESCNLFNSSVFCDIPLAGEYLEALKERFPEIYNSHSGCKITSAQESGDISFLIKGRLTNREESADRTLANIELFSKVKVLRDAAWTAFKADIGINSFFGEIVKGFYETMREASDVIGLLKTNKTIYL